MTSHVSDRQGGIQKLLEQPSYFLSFLAESISKDLAFYSHDLLGRFVYLSRSTEQVLNHNPIQWLGRSFREALTTAACNDPIRPEFTPDRIKASIQGGTCEIYDGLGIPLRLQFWSTPIMHEGVPIGKTGIVQRVAGGPDDSKYRKFLSMANQLTPNEREVVEYVVAGLMNKSIASRIGVAIRTVESRRSKAMQKLQLRSLPELVQLWMQVKEAEAYSNPHAANE